MADTIFEQHMDGFVAQNLPWDADVQLRNSTGHWVSAEGQVKESLDYRVGFMVKNIGSETFAKDVQVRVANAYPGRVTFYTNDSYTQITQQVNQGYQGTLGPGQSTPRYWVYFRVGGGRDERKAIANIGIYANIIPQGHAWSDFERSLD